MKTPHALYVQLRRIREERDLSLHAVEHRHPTTVTAVGLGSWERGDRQPPPARLDEVLRTVYGKKLAIIPADADVDGLLAELAELQAFRDMVVGHLDPALVAQRTGGEVAS